MVFLILPYFYNNKLKKQENTMEEIVKDDYCLICGAPVPEGRQICPECERILESEQDD